MSDGLTARGLKTLLVAPSSRCSSAAIVVGRGLVSCVERGLISARLPLDPRLIAACFPSGSGGSGTPPCTSVRASIAQRRQPATRDTFDVKRVWVQIGTGIARRTGRPHLPSIRSYRRQARLGPTRCYVDSGRRSAGKSVRSLLHFAGLGLVTPLVCSWWCGHDRAGNGQRAPSGRGAARMTDPEASWSLVSSSSGTLESWASSLGGRQFPPRRAGRACNCKTSLGLKISQLVLP